MTLSFRTQDAFHWTFPEQLLDYFCQAMAELVTAPPPKTRKRKYPYEAWFIGGWVKLTQGVDFDIEAASMSNNILSFARRNGIEASVEVHREPRFPDNPQMYVYVHGDPIRV